MKTGRQEAILEILREQEIETQNQLLSVLRQRGIHTTQATLSRDIREMHLVKELGESGKYRYTSSAHEESARTDRMETILRESLVSCDLAQNILVLKTLSGLAPGVCAALDAMKLPGLIGTLAGDDTAFLAMRDLGSAEKLSRELEELF